MAFDKTPTTWIENYASDGTDMTLPLASFPEITAGEAHTATGDIRKILFGFVEKLWLKWNGTVNADRPGKMTVAKTSSINVGAGTTTHTYTISFVTVTTAQDVADEA